MGRKGGDRESRSASHKPEDGNNSRGSPKWTGVQAPCGSPQVVGSTPGRQAPRTSGFVGQGGFILGDPEGCGK